MEQRSIWKMVVYTLITFGIYPIVWLFMTKEEMNHKGATIPSFICALIPFVNIWWYWHYSEGVEHVSENEGHKLATFLLLLFVSGLAPFIVQHFFNRIDERPSLPRAVARC